jgi:hypothetical protein
VLGDLVVPIKPVRRRSNLQRSLYEFFDVTEELVFLGGHSLLELAKRLLELMSGGRENVQGCAAEFLGREGRGGGLRAEAGHGVKCKGRSSKSRYKCEI